jgi:hypothetical protein
MMTRRITGIPEAIMSSRTIPPHLVELFETVKFAIAHRRQLILMYGGFRREVCPHSLGWKNDHLSCFAYQFAGGSRKALPPGGQWRCLHLHSMSEVRTQEGEWHTGPIDPQSSSCVDEFEAYVGFPEMAGMAIDEDINPALIEALTPLAESMDSLITHRIDEALAPLRRRIDVLEREIGNWPIRTPGTEE